MTQKDVYDYLKANSYGVKVHVGDLEDLNGEDYIFLDFLSADLIGSDNKGTYRTYLQITIATRDWKTRTELVKYVIAKFNVSITYEPSATSQYYLARCQTAIILNG